MKKMLYLFLTILIVSCSSDDDNNKGINPDLIGFWYDSVNDAYIDFFEDGSGKADGELISWSTTDTFLIITFEIDEENVMFEYVFLNDDKVRLTIDDEELGYSSIIIERQDI